MAIPIKGPALYFVLYPDSQEVRFTNRPEEDTTFFRADSRNIKTAITESFRDTGPKDEYSRQYVINKVSAYNLEVNPNPPHESLTDADLNGWYYIQQRIREYEGYDGDPDGSVIGLAEEDGTKYGTGTKNGSDQMFRGLTFDGPFDLDNLKLVTERYASINFYFDYIFAESIFKSNVFKLPHKVEDAHVGSTQYAFSRANFIQDMELDLRPMSPDGQFTMFDYMFYEFGAGYHGHYYGGDITIRYENFADSEGGAAYGPGYTARKPHMFDKAKVYNIIPGISFKQQNGSIYETGSMDHAYGFQNHGEDDPDGKKVCIPVLGVLGSGNYAFKDYANLFGPGIRKIKGVPESGMTLDRGGVEYDIYNTQTDKYDTFLPMFDDAINLVTRRYIYGPNGGKDLKHVLRTNLGQSYGAFGDAIRYTPYYKDSEGNWIKCDAYFNDSEDGIPTPNIELYEG